MYLFWRLLQRQGIIVIGLLLGAGLFFRLPGTTGADSLGPLALTFPSNPLISPADREVVLTARPRLDWEDAQGGVVSYTLVITGPANTTVVTTTASAYTPTLTANGIYTWTVQAHNGPEVSGFVDPPYRFTLSTTWQVFLPVVHRAPPGCPTSSSASFELIPIDGPPYDHPDYAADLNLGARGYEVTSGTKGLVDYSGGTDPDAPQLDGLFEPNSYPGINEIYQVYDWNWGCGPHGCRGSILTYPPVTLIGLNTTPGQAIYIPERNADIYQGIYRAMVLYADERRITLEYTRRDTVAVGYSVHLENVCVDPNLLALYRAQVDANGWHVTGKLPALRNNQALGTAYGTEIRVAIRDRGSFMDPRSRKDWWKRY